MNKEDLDYHIQEIECCLKCKHSSIINKLLFCEILHDNVEMAAVCNAFNPPEGSVGFEICGKEVEGHEYGPIDF